MSEKINECYIFDSFAERYRDNFMNNTHRVLQHIGKYINERTEILQTKNVGLRLLYTATNENDFYDCLDVDKADLIQIIRSSPNLDHGIPDQMNPLYNLLMMLSCFYEAHEKEMKAKYGDKVNYAHMVRMYLTLRIYSICQRQIFAYVPKEELMDYTIQHLSARFDLALTKNIYSLLEDYMMTNNRSLEANLKHIDDMKSYLFVSKLIRRIKSMLRNVFAKMLENYENGNRTQTEDLQQTNEDGKEFYVVSTSVSNTIDVLTKKIATNFVQDQNIRINLLKIACKRAGSVNFEKIRIILSKMRDSGDEKLLRTIISDILSYWIISLQNPANTIHSQQFIKKCSGAYAISNTYNTFIMDLKVQLNKLIDKYAEEYTETETKSTLNRFKQCIFLYMVFYISAMS